MLSVVLSQQVTQLPLHSAPMPESAALAALAAVDSSWETRTNALEALAHKHHFTSEEIDVLTKALAKASRAPTDSVQCHGVPPSACVLNVGPCLSPAGFILASVEGSNANGHFVDAALEVLDSGSDPSALASALDILAVARHPRVEAEAQTLLERDFVCTDKGAWLLRSLPELSAETRAQLEATLQWRETESFGIAELLASRPEPWAQERALGLLHHRDARLRLAVLHSFGAQLQRNPQLAEVLVGMAQCDASARLRDEASEILKQLGIVVPPTSCPRPVWTVSRRVVSGPGGKVKLVAAPPDSESPGGCLGKINGDCIVAIDQGEWGGALVRRRRNGKTEEIVRDGFLNPVALLQNGTESLVLSALKHLSGSGGVGRLRTKPDGSLTYEPWLHFMGVPAAWAVSGGRVFIAFEPGELSACRDPLGETTLVFEADGGWSLAGGDGTECLWPKQ